MREIVLRTLLIVAAVLLAGSCAWSSVTVTWGSESVALNLIANPDSGDAWWMPQVWYGELPITMTSLAPIVFTGSGNFNNLSGVAVPWVRIKQTVTNNTNYDWTDFHVALSGGQFYKKWLVQNGWDATQTQTAFDYVVGDTGSPIAPGGTFVDGFVLQAQGLDAGGNGSFTLTKWPTVPEAGTAAAMASGMLGLLAYIKRRRA